MKMGAMKIPCEIEFLQNVEIYYPPSQSKFPHELQILDANQINLGHFHEIT